MVLQVHLGCVILSCLVWLTLPAFPWSEFKLAYVTDHSLIKCTCVKDLAACVIDSSECNCKNQSFSALWLASSSSLVHVKRLTVWYTSPLNVALLLNHSEIRHLSLVRCNSSEGKPTSTSFTDYFAVQQLERLTVSFPLWRSGQTQDIVLGRDMGALYHEEARLAIIQTSVLLGETNLKAYTVHTIVDSSGLPAFPNLFTFQDGLPETSSIFVTFLY
ncbi:uncharacterized protein LOC115810406 [Chanos chanos]|uniref:Uncharacterized protein LOC115810406 n=1 Tax=Chanos chanos TaxID=29144 RepID=A0A6J2V5G6_CHACN|nr:uncharacterized protein LOC115810406 [Chanos chanos]